MNSGSAHPPAEFPERYSTVFPRRPRGLPLLSSRGSRRGSVIEQNLRALSPSPTELATGTGYPGNEFIAGEAGREIVRPTKVIPADITQDILAANAFSQSTPQPNFSSINDGLTWNQSMQQQGNSPFGEPSSTDGSSALINEVRAMRSDFRQAQSKGGGILVDKYRERFDERRNRNSDRVAFRK